MWTKGGREFKWKFGTGNDLPNERNHYWLPAVGWNQYDRMMLGLVLHNTSLPAPKLRYSLVPMYSFGRKNLSGLGDISYNPLGGKRYKSLRIGVSAMTFQYDEAFTDTAFTISLRHPSFSVIKPYVIMELGNSKRRNGFSNFIEVTGVLGIQKMGWFDRTENLGCLRFSYFGKKRGPISAFEYKASFESVSRGKVYPGQGGFHIGGETTGRIQAEAKYTWNYIATKKKLRSIELRGYWGTVFVLDDLRHFNIVDRYAHDENMYLMLSGASGQQDVFYDEYFRGRSSAPTNGNNSLHGQYNYTTNGQQRMNNMGGMGTATFMGSNRSLTAINFSMSLPKLPSMIRIFADYSMMPTARNLSPEQLELPTKFFDAGLMIRTGFLQVSVPLFMNNDLLKTLGGIEEVGGPGGVKQYVLPTYKQQLQRGIRFSLNIPLNSGLFLRKSLLPSI